MVGQFLYHFQQSEIHNYICMIHDYSQEHDQIYDLSSFYFSFQNWVQDHHCQWINNCVGYWNYKAFFILVLYATIGSIYSTVCFIWFFHSFCFEVIRLPQDITKLLAFLGYCNNLFMSKGFWRKGSPQEFLCELVFNYSIF